MTRALLVTLLLGFTMTLVSACGKGTQVLSLDGGPAADGGPAEDGGPAADGGPAEDGGPAADGGPTEDGGPAMDGGPAEDGGLSCPVPYNKSRLWGRTWSDEFNGPEPGQESCYDNNITPPQCLTLYWHTETCPVSAHANLEGLNKCNWAVFSLYNWMDNGKPIGEGVNAFTPHQVTVQGGELILSSVPSPPPGGYPAGWNASTPIQTVMAEYDCGNPPATGYGPSTECPIVSGGLWSKTMGSVTGLKQTYGRFEIKARLPVGQGSWPAHWMLPQSGPWPGDGEIDIMEAVAYKPNQLGANFHDGVTINVPGGDDINTHMSAGSMDLDITKDQQSQEYHTYAVEWDATTLRFFVDNREIGEVKEGTLAPNKNLATGEYVGDYPFEIPDEPFHMILNSTVAAFGATNYPHPKDFPTQTHHIDYTRAWKLCESTADYCPKGGSYDGANCRVGTVPNRNDVFIHKSSLVYPALSGALPCPDGGSQREGLCMVHEIGEGTKTFIWGSSFYIANACVASTISPSCQNPCLGVGRWDGYNCHLLSAPEGSTASIDNGIFYYTPVSPSAGGPCPIGCDEGNRCRVGPAPAGREVFVWDSRHYYTKRLCDPTAGMANCPKPCPIAGRHDGKDCYISTPPPGTNPFIYQNGFYYQPMTGYPRNGCPLGVYDSVHCYMGAAPTGTTALLKGEKFYVKAACGNVPRAWFHPSN